MTAAKELFRIDAVHGGLRRHAVRSGAATIVARITQLLLQLGSAIALARLLTPSDFGLIAMVSPLAVLANNIANLGLQTTIIHREHLESREATALFWYAARLNLMIAGLMIAAAFVLARLYHEPRAIGIAIAWAATIYVATFASIHEALLKRQMAFTTVLTVQVGAILVSLIAAVTAALSGAGYWALIVQVSVMELSRAATLWVICPWRPGRSSPGGEIRSALRTLRGYWTSLSGARVIAWFGDQVDRVFMGAVGGAPVLGLYDAGKRWATFPFIELWLALSDVAVASLSRARRNADTYRLYVQNTFLPLLSAAFPAMAYMFVEAPIVIRVLLGNQWIGAVPFVRLLCVASAAGSLSRLMQWIYASTGQTARQLRWSLVTTPVMLTSLAVGATRGAVGVAVGYLTGIALLALPGAAYALRLSPVPLGECFRIFVRPVFASLGAAALLFALDQRLPVSVSPAVAIAVTLPCFLLSYAILWTSLPGGLRSLRILVAGTHDLRASPPDMGPLPPTADP